MTLLWRRLCLEDRLRSERSPPGEPLEANLEDVVASDPSGHRQWEKMKASSILSIKDEVS